MKRVNLRSLLLSLLLTLSTGIVSQADTDVGGPLPTGTTTTWSLSGSPYRVIQNLEVPASSKLLIEPGVEVRIGKYSLIVNGSLVARGSKEQNVLFTIDRTDRTTDRWGSIQFNSDSSKAGFDSAGQYISGCLLEHVTLEQGQGIIIHRASPAIRNCRILNNMKEEGGAILSVDGSPLIQDCEITRNQSARNGGGIRTIGGQPTIKGCRISFNTAIRGAGGGISSDFSKPEILDNTISHNMAYEGGGIATGIPHGSYLSTAAHSLPRIVGNTIDHNYATIAGGGIFVSGTPQITSNVISNNCLGFGLLKESEIKIRTSDFADRTTTRKNVGAGIYVENTFGGHAIIDSNQIIHNHGAEWGGGLHLSRGSAVVDSNRFVSNHSSSGGGGATVVFVQEHESPGSLRHGTTTKLVNNEFLNNHGGAVELAGNAQHSIIIDNCVFQLNPPFEVINHSLTHAHISNCQFESDDPLELQKLLYDRYDHLAFGKLVMSQTLAKGKIPITEEAKQRKESLASVSPRKLEAATSIINVPNTHDLVLQWEPVTHRDVAGYYVYLVDGETLIGAPFGIGGTSHEGQSPIDIGLNASTKITGLRADHVYHFAVTAYDRQGNESGFSNIASARTSASTK
jgi:hypothetical protein